MGKCIYFTIYAALDLECTAGPIQCIYSGYDPELGHHISHIQTHVSKIKFNIALPFPSRNHLFFFLTADREKESSVLPEHVSHDYTTSM